MTMFSDAAARVHERIKAAPVEEWLKKEAREDLRRLIEAHELSVAEDAIRESRDYDEREMTLKSTAVKGEYLPSDFEMRRMALDLAVARWQGISGSVAESAKMYYAFLKGE